MLSLFRTLLFVPGDRERMLQAAVRSPADVIVIDLEDAVAAGAKQDARDRARAAIAPLGAAERPVFVRVNAIASGMTRDDAMAIVGPGLAGVVLPKCDDAQDLRDLDVLLREAEMANGVRPGDVATIPIVESARAVLRCEAIALASDRIVALSVGGEDYTRDIGARRDASGAALHHIRSVVVNVAAAYGLLAIDTPYADYRDAAGLLKDAKIARALGMNGKYVIHPDQVAAVNKAFTPTAAEVADARRIVAAFDRAATNGAGAISFDGRMVDAPIAARARALIAAASAGKPARPSRRSAASTPKPRSK